MSDQEHPRKNNAVEQIIGNMTAEMQNTDGQYAPLGYTPAPKPSEPLNWMPQQVSHSYGLPNEPTMFTNVQPPGFNPMNYNSYMQQPHMFGANNFNAKHRSSLSDINYEPGFDLYQNLHPQRMDLDPNYALFLSQQNLGAQHSNSMGSHMVQNQQPQVYQNHPHNTQLIENLVGNWAPNTSGTYSPFGNTDFKTNANVFEILSDKENTKDDDRFYSNDLPMEETKFQFTRDTKKPRMVAEVKPMRPTYSDVLTKAPHVSVPNQTSQNKASKAEGGKDKDVKPKKDSSKKGTKEKVTKQGTPLNRANTNNEFNIKDAQSDKTTANIKPKPSKFIKTGQLDRKWASLDNISEPTTSPKIEKVSKKKEEDPLNKTFPKANFKKVVNKPGGVEQQPEVDNGTKPETSFVIKNGSKKGNKLSGRNKNNDSFGSSDRPSSAKRTPRTRKREDHPMLRLLKEKVRNYLKDWWKIVATLLLWFFRLISDVCSLSVHLSRDVASSSWTWICLNWIIFLDNLTAILKRIRLFTWLYEKFKKKEKVEEQPKQFSHAGLHNNINMPTTGDEAMKRLLACKGKDPYSILGVTLNCTDDDIKRYYKRQAVLVHPDKNQQPGAEEAFKILVHAFDMIGEPERRASYDRGVAESAQVEQAWSELTELLSQLQQKVEAAANTIRCSACGLRHKRVKIDRPCYAARKCAQCKIHHSAREGDIWAEAQCLGFLWHYYACMEGGVYDITEWAGCQKDSLKHLKPDSHHVQYRIALGKQSNNPPRRPSTSPRTERPPDLENLLNSLYGQTANGDNSQNARKRNKNKAGKY